MAKPGFATDWVSIEKTSIEKTGYSLFNHYLSLLLNRPQALLVVDGYERIGHYLDLCVRCVDEEVVATQNRTVLPVGLRTLARRQVFEWGKPSREYPVSRSRPVAESETVC
jgi:hypothetical protein